MCSLLVACCEELLGVFSTIATIRGGICYLRVRDYGWLYLGEISLKNARDKATVTQTQ